MTRLELNNYVDSEVTNKTTANSLTPTNEGNAIKKVADYVDQQDDLKEDLINKSTNVTTDGASDTKYPSVKAVKTYVDANSGGTQVTKSIKVSLTSAEILALFTTPKEILQATTGKLYIPRNVFQKLTFGTVAYTYSGNVRLAYNTASNWVSQFTPFITANDSGESITALNINGASVTGGTYSGKSLLLTAITTNPTGGDGTLDLYITYYEITI